MNDPQESTSPAGRSPPRTWRVLAGILLGAVIGFLALRSSPYVQHLPWMPRWLGEWADSNGIVRNVVAFFALGLGWFVLVSRQWWHVIALAGFGVALEVAQRWIPGRIFDWRDIIASLAGVLFAWLAAALLARRPR